MAARRDVGGTLYDESGVYSLIQRTLKDISALGDTELIPAQGAGNAIRVLALVVISATAVTVRIKSAGNNLSAAFALAINGKLELQYLPHGWFQTNDNEALNINQSLAIASGVHVIWMVV